MRLCFVWRRPAVSTRRRSAFRASATAHASWTTAAGSAPALCFTSGTFSRVAQTSSCSTAAARNVSAAARTTDFPAATARAASLAAVVVLPVPFTPTMRITCGDPGRDGRARGRRAAVSISALRTRRTTSCSAASRRPASAFTAATSSAAVAGPTSAARRPSSSASSAAGSGANVALIASPTFASSSVWVMKSPRFRRAKTRTIALAVRHRPPRLAGPRGSGDLGDEARAGLVEPRARGVRLARLVEDDENEVARLHVRREDPPVREVEREVGDLAEARALGRAAQLSQPDRLVGSENVRRALGRPRAR